VHAIVLVEESCADLSGITGFFQIRFLPANTSARFDTLFRSLRTTCAARHTSHVLLHHLGVFEAG